MKSLYEKNGLVFWSEEEIRLRRMMEDHFVPAMKSVLKSQNKAWEFFQVEASILTPAERINPNYTNEDVFTADQEDELVLRPETTMGSYAYAKHLLRATELKIRMPLCVWQHGKSFRKEQDKVLAHMRLKEFYQLEFQSIYSPSTANDYSKSVIPAVQKMISEMIGECRVEPSDRIPDYAEWTQDVVCEATDMEVCSISMRTDFEDAKVLEVAIGTDRCVYNFLQK